MYIQYIATVIDQTPGIPQHIICHNIFGLMVETPRLRVTHHVAITRVLIALEYI